MAVDRVSSLRAYRDLLVRRFDQATHAALEPIPEGAIDKTDPDDPLDWSGMQVVRRKELERVIGDLRKADVEPSPAETELRTPGIVFVDAVCPRCDIPARILVSLRAELVVSDEGATVGVKAKSKASSHVCGQMPLEVADPGEQLSLDVATEEIVVFRDDVPRPDDAAPSLGLDERCATEIVRNVDGDETTLVCDRRLDHDATSDEDGRDHWAEGGYGWHFEVRPALRAVETPEEEEDQDDEDGAS